MDDRFRHNGLPTPAGSQFQQPLAPSQLNGTQSHLHTLPPLHSSTPSFPSLYGNSSSNPQTPMTPHTPSTSGPSSSNTSIPPISAHPPLRPLQPSPSYAYNASSYPSSQPSLLPSATANANTHVLAPAPLSNGLQDLRAGGLGLTPHTQMYPHPPILSNQEPEPVHVVGQQGRRGVLPTHPGRPAPAPGKGPLNPQKNADNKYECPHCSKTYLHLKHLKRHLLRHTGERPYQCHLCKDTFSRSDILKRHFQKCSIRRGNPTGANHLQHAQNHLQKNRNSTDASGYMSHVNTSMPYSDGSYSSSLMAMPPLSTEHAPYSDAVTSLSARTSRSNSLIRPAGALEENRRSLSNIDFNSRVNFNEHDFRTSSGLQNSISHGMNSYGSQQGQTPGVQATSAPGAYGYAHNVAHQDISQSMPIKVESSHTDSNTPSYGRPTLPNLDGLNGTQDNGLRWNGSFNAESQDNFLLTTSSMVSDNAASRDAFNDLYTSNASGFVDASSFPDNWVLAISDPLQNKADELISFCYPPRSTTSESNDAQGCQMLKEILTAENLKHFLVHFQHFESHWPMIHLPTFDLASTNNGLLFSMVCIGAVYSDKVSITQVRWLMELAKVSVRRSSHVFRFVTQNSEQVVDFTSRNTLEEIQALILLQSIFTWHGNHSQREQGRAEFWVLAAIACQLNLFNPVPYQKQGFSILHLNGPLDSKHAQSWRWSSWLEQEKRSRAFYLIFLIDAALVMFFNSTPQFDGYDIKIPLPADDAAWEAKSEEECADALGLKGKVAQFKNTTGSRRPKQMVMQEALQQLYQNAFPIQATNVYSKFLLIHALHVQIFKIQRQISSAGTGYAGLSSSGSSTPHSPIDYINGDGPLGSLSNATSGRVTPVEGLHAQYPPAQALRLTNAALDNWKQVWDNDMPIQYPPSQRRVGFCRDAVHFYYLAKMFIQQSRLEDWNASADIRLQHVFGMLKQVKSFVASEQEQQGLEIGSVTTIDDNYGVGDLTLDMKLLFTPVDQNTD